MQQGLCKSSTQTQTPTTICQRLHLTYTQSHTHTHTHTQTNTHAWGGLVDVIYIHPSTCVCHSTLNGGCLVGWLGSAPNRKVKDGRWGRDRVVPLQYEIILFPLFHNSLKSANLIKLSVAEQCPLIQKDPLGELPARVVANLINKTRQWNKSELKVWYIR